MSDAHESVIPEEVNGEELENAGFDTGKVAPKKRGPKPRPKVDQSDDAEKRELQRQIKAQQEQLELALKLINELKEQAKPEMQQLNTGLLLPKPPAPIVRREGVEFELMRRTEKMDQTENAVRSTFIRVIPPRADDPNKPDPRYCVYCSFGSLGQTLGKKKPGSVREPNLATLYGVDISSTPTPEQEAELRQLHRDHMRQMELWAESPKVGGERKSLGLTHMNLSMRYRGRIPDQEAFRCSGRRDGENIVVTAEELNAERMSNYEEKLLRLSDVARS